MKNSKLITQENISLEYPTSEKYIMFLPERYFKPTFFESIYKKIRKNLENTGISLFSINKIIPLIKTKDICFLFDDEPFPVNNQLYIHMYKNIYYSDTLYNKKCIEKEREMLFLLAGKLGVKQITYDIDICKTSLCQIKNNINAHNIETGISYNKNVENTQGTSGKEIYENRGAPVYLISKNIIELNKNIKEKMDNMESKVFSYDFYKFNPKLESFVYKRFEFKMSKLEYTIESDDISEISLAVKAYFMEYGLNISYDKNLSISEKFTYILEFYTDTELSEIYEKRKYDYERSIKDPFYSIRKSYENWTDKKMAVNEIFEYMLKLVKQCYAQSIINDKNMFIYYNMENLFKYLLQSKPTNFFEEACHEFTHTTQIKLWIEKLLTEQICSDNECINILKSQYTDITYVPYKLFWFNIDWKISDDLIINIIKNELNNECKEIVLNRENNSFSVINGNIIISSKLEDNYNLSENHDLFNRRVKLPDIDVNMNKFENEILELHEINLPDTDVNMNKFENKILELHEINLQNNSEINSLRAKLEYYTNFMTSTADTPSNQNENKQLKEELVKNNAIINELKNYIENIQSKNDKLLSDNKQLNEELLSGNAIINELKNYIENIQSNNEQLKEENIKILNEFDITIKNNVEKQCIISSLEAAIAMEKARNKR